MKASQSLTNPPQPRSRGRKPTFARDDALQIALELFWWHGYDGVSVADLTKAIGIAAPSLYHAFGSKADLYREVIRLYSSIGMTTADIDDAASSRDAARQMLERGIEAVTTPGRPLGCMVSSGMLMTSPGNAELAAEIKIARASLRKALERRIVRDIEDGNLPRCTDADGLARFFNAVLHGISVQALDGASALDLTAIAAFALKAWPNASATRED